MHVQILHMPDDYLLALLPLRDTSPQSDGFFRQRNEEIQTVRRIKKSLHYVMHLSRSHCFLY